MVFVNHSLWLGEDASNLSKIMAGLLVPGDKLRGKLAAKIGLSGGEAHRLLDYRRTSDQHYHDNELETFAVISDWYHLALLEVFKLGDYQCSSPREIAGLLGIGTNEVKEAIERLIKVGMVKKNGTKGRYEVVESSSNILSIATSKAHRNHQMQILQKAQDALQEIPLEFRSQSSMTMAIDRKRLPQALDMIKEFRRGLARYLSDGQELNDIYHLSVSLYPVTELYKEIEA